MNILLNYANGYYKKSQLLNSKSGIEIGGFDKVVSCSPKNIDSEFWHRNLRILSQKRFGGYCLWKPYIIHKALLEMSHGDVLFYCDSGAVFKQPMTRFLENFRTGIGDDIICFEWRSQEKPSLEKQWTKRDCFLLMDCDTPKYWDSTQRLASFSVYKKTSLSVDFVMSWLRYCEDERIVTDLPNTCGKPNYPEYIQHRHDQSVFSLLAKKYGFAAFRDPSQNGNEFMDIYPNSQYGQLIDHTRRRNKSLLQKIKRGYWRSVSATRDIAQSLSAKTTSNKS